MTTKFKKILSRLGWILLSLAVANSACMLAFRIGKEKGVNDLLKEIQEPELQIIPRDGQGAQLILIRQIFPDNEFKNTVRIDVSAFEGVEATRLSDSSWGRLGYAEEVTLWQISNTTDREIKITEAAFTNLPQDFSLKSDYYNESVIRLKPKS